MSRRTDTDDVRQLVRACASEDAGARRTFQERYGQDIYNFPVKIYGVPVERAVDFYVYVFERDRIFTRMRTFEGRNGIQFRTFLAYYVLKSLFLEWQRGHRELDTVSLSDQHVADGGEPPAAPAGDRTETGDDPAYAPASEAVAALWGALGPEEQLDLKLLSLLEYQLTADDVRLLARISRRSLGETVALLAEVEAGLRERDVKLARLRDELDSVWGWIVLRRRELQETSERLRLMGSNHQSVPARRLVERNLELEHALAKRVRQHECLLDEMRRFKMTTPYKDIARLLNSTVGTVCSRIFRLRDRLERRLNPGQGEAAP
jgi:RNA polymerase sigma factor (sigma-70 family)